RRRCKKDDARRTMVREVASSDEEDGVAL
ncbi:hypothetical protein A2U01_0028722, partial [Trifolium medium]|nr:hypothetical protein [Trifolium medium]